MKALKWIGCGLVLVFVGGCSREMQTPSPEAAAEFAEAALNGDAAQVGEALKARMPVDVLDENGNSALMLAAFNGQVEVMRLLIKAGAEIDRRDGNGRTALMFAASGPFPEAVELLLRHGAAVNAVDAVEQFTALMFAAAEGHARVAEVLLQHGADPGLKDKDGDTAATFARQRGHRALAARLDL